MKQCSNCQTEKTSHWYGNRTKKYICRNCYYKLRRTPCKKCGVISYGKLCRKCFGLSRLGNVSRLKKRSLNIRI